MEFLYCIIGLLVVFVIGLFTTGIIGSIIANAAIEEEQSDEN